MRTIRLLGVWLAVALGTAAQAAAQTGSINGTVTTAVANPPSVTAYDSSGRFVSSASGSPYSLTGLTAGTYYLVASASGNVTELYNDKACVAEDCDKRTGTPVFVTAGGTATANFALSAGGTIQGTVRRASDGTGVDSVTVFLYNQATSFVATTTTAANGTYSFVALPTGSYFLRIGAPAPGKPAPDYVQELYGNVLCPLTATSFICRVSQGTPVSVTDGATTSNVDFTLDHGARINGQVTLAGTAVAGVTVRAYSGGVPLGFQTTTDASGFYTVQGLAPGTYAVRADPSTASTPNLVEMWYLNIPFASGVRPTPVTVAAGAAATGINFALTAGGSANGSVTYADATGGTVPAKIEVYSAASGALVKSLTLPSGSPAPFTIAGLPTGTYYLKAASPSVSGGTPGYFVDELFNNIVCVATDCLPSSGTPISVTAGAATNGLDIVLQTGGSIIGSSPVGTVVDVYDSRGVLLTSRSSRRLNPAHMLGVIDVGHQITGLPAGTYYLVARRNETANTAPELYGYGACDGCAVTFGTPVVVTAGGTSSASFTGIAGGTIAGAVTDDSLAGLSTIDVEVYNQGGALVATATTNALGTYRVTALAPGSHYVRTVNTRGYADEIYDNLACAGCSVFTGAPLNVPANDTIAANFSLSAGVNVGGIVRADLGGPLPGTSVSLFSSTGTLVAQGVADAFGRYTVSLAAGSYRARTDPKPGWIQELYNNAPCATGNCNVVNGAEVLVALAPVTNVDFSLAICSARVISPIRLATAAVGIAYNQTLAITPSTSLRRFAITAGGLPPGLTLDPLTGAIAGTATIAGAYTFTVSVTDTNGCVSSREYTLDVPACAFNLVSTSASVRAAGEQVSVELRNTCGTPTAVANDSWTTVDSVNSINATFTVAANTAATPRTGTVTIGPRVFTVFQGGTTLVAPFGTVDTPADGSSGNGSIAVTGWALDDRGVVRVSIYRDPVSGETPGQPVFIGDATFVTGARPDVEAAFPGLPAANRAGWGYLLLTNMLPNQGNGPFRLLAFAVDADGGTTLLGAKTFVGNNATAISPFGAIDTPAQGATVSGRNYTNFGWALTPQPKQIPVNGSTIQVYVDGAPIGPLTQYNLFRSDVSNLFPNLTNSGGPVGYRTIDTTALSEGVHTIAWVATDNAGQATGIGSRYFTVNNSAWQPSLKKSDDEVPPAEVLGVPPRIAGPDLGRRSANLSLLPIAEAAVALHRDEDAGEAKDVGATDTGLRTITVKELDRIELSLATAEACASSYAGYTVARGEVRDLPIGASLDATGRFYWQTAPGFIGSYRLVFVRTGCDGRRERIPVTITIQPK